MKLCCNIDKIGRALRFAAGFVLLADGLLLYRYEIPGSGLLSRALQVFLMAAGAFGMFEGVMGWCAIRAMGIRTRI